MTERTAQEGDASEFRLKRQNWFSRCCKVENWLKGGLMVIKSHEEIRGFSSRGGNIWPNWACKTNVFATAKAPADVVFSAQTQEIPLAAADGSSDCQLPPSAGQSVGL